MSLQNTHYNPTLLSFCLYACDKSKTIKWIFINFVLTHLRKYFLLSFEMYIGQFMTHYMRAHCICSLTRYSFQAIRYFRQRIRIPCNTIYVQYVFPTSVIVFEIMEQKEACLHFRTFAWNGAAVFRKYPFPADYGGLEV